ncbi:hypothetical protein BZA05DRAFT_414113, partial [Tricharina praecox]|uniref:uncharacterized protein n=1 Tax=Tricharina praecox TaxID=43433 RepID=UPI002220B56D
MSLFTPFVRISILLLSRKLFILAVGILVAADLVRAQQPVAELGGWPPGAFTLFVGLWIAAQSALQRNYDTSFPPCTRPGLHRIPYIKRLLWAGDTVGQSVNVLVLSSLKAPKWNLLSEYTTDDDERSGVWEWDILTVYKAGECPTAKFTKMPPTDPSGNFIYKMTIEAPATCGLQIGITFTANPAVDIDAATTVLFDTLFDVRYACCPCADLLLLLWRGLQNYQASWVLRHGDGDTAVATGELYSCQRIVQAVKDYRDWPKEVLNWSHGGDKLRLYVENPTDTSDEAAPGSTIRNDIFHAGQLVAMLIYAEKFPCATAVNPLIPLIYRWSQGLLPTTDNFQFNLRLFKKAGAPPSPPGLESEKEDDAAEEPLPTAPIRRSEAFAAPRPPPTPLMDCTKDTTCSTASSLPIDDQEKLLTYYEINLSEGEIQIDGGGYLGSQRYAWIWSTVVGGMIAFFVALGGTANPSFATAMGLSFLRPYSNDDNYTDAGSPLTWGGRRRIRWNEDKACGIFSGQTNLRLGKTGNSLHRGCIFLAISWVAWCWRNELRTALAFSEPTPAATWVKWAAVALEVHAGLWMFLGAYLYYVRRIFSVVVVNIIAGVHVIVVVVL